MNRVGWFLLNITLVAALCGIGILLGESDPTAHWRDVKQSIIDTAAPAEKEPEAQDNAETVADTEINRFPMDSRTADVLWKHTLFNPDRTEDIEIKQEAEAAEKEAIPEYQFEIRGIMMVRDSWVVSLSVKQGSAPSRAARTVRSRRVSVAKRAASKPAEPEKPKRTTHVYHVGDAVQETGYVVADISMQEVTLKRGDEELVLSVDLNDEMSKKRRDEAARVEAAKKPPTKQSGPKNGTPVATANRGASSPPPPPPAPGASTVPPSIGKAASTKGTTLEERLKRIRERRAELQKKHATKSSTK